MLLNVLEIDNYRSPMKFELHTTHYEACMEEGMKDDNIQKCIVTQVTSVRGLDVAFIAQYNERIIMDCITSTKQLPVRFPLPANKKEEEALKEKDTDFNLREGGFEQMDICRGGKMVRQRMVLDEEGAVYFMMKTENDTVRVMRMDPMAEMGDHKFVKTVFSLRSSLIYFLLFYCGRFYLMDDQKKIRVLRPDKETHILKQMTNMELSEKDAASIMHSEFDEFAIS